MPVLPLIDLLLLGGWTALLVGFVLKVIHLTTTYRPTIFTLAPNDFLEMAIAAMLFAIALAARTWVKTQDAGPTAARRRDETLAAWNKLHKLSEATDVAEAGHVAEPSPVQQTPHRD